MANFYFGLSEDYNYFTAKRDIRKGKVQLLAGGLMIPGKKNVERSRDSIRRIYGFKALSIGCIIPPGIDRYNETVEDYLTVPTPY